MIPKFPDSPAAWLGTVYPYRMVFCALLVLGWQRPPAEGVLKGVIANYRKLKSLTVTVVHHADFLAAAKDSVDTVSWLAPRRFEIVSNNDSVPKLACDGKRLTTFIPQVAPIGEPLDFGSDRTQPWENRGGIVLSILMRGPMADQWLHPAKTIKASFAYGTAMEWRGSKVNEIVETLNVHGAIEHVSFYLSGNSEHIVGVEVQSGPQSAWTKYDNEVENPDLPKTLGAA